MKSDRIGKIKLEMFPEENNREFGNSLIMHLGMVVHHTEFDFINNILYYTGYSDKFDIIKGDETIPFYEVKFDNDNKIYVERKQ